MKSTSIPIRYPQYYNMTSERIKKMVSRPQIFSLVLKDVLISDKLIKNLISVRCFTIDNYVSVSFDHFGFTVKDFKTGAFIQRCNSHGELYPVVPSSSPLSASATSLSALSSDT